MWAGEGLGRGMGVRCVGVHLTKGHPAQNSTKLGHETHTGGGVRGGVGCEWCRCVGYGIHLIKGQPDPEADHMSS